MHFVNSSVIKIVLWLFCKAVVRLRMVSLPAITAFPKFSVRVHRLPQWGADGTNAHHNVEP